jgi:PAS domain S-box-containing protein
MSPDTALFFLLFGFVLVFHDRISAVRRVNRSILAAVIVLSLYGALKCIEYFIGIDITLAGILFPSTEKVGEHLIKRMSPVTGLLFFLFGGALIVLHLFRGKNTFRNGVSVAGLLISSVGFIAVIGYLYGTPILYGENIIPLAAPTALGFFALGIGLIAVSGSKNIIVLLFAGDSPKAKLLRIIVPMIMVTMVLQGLLEELFDTKYSYNHALATALFSITFAVFMSIVVVKYFNVIFRQIEQKEREGIRAERIAFQKENQFHSVLESISLIGLIIDVEGNIILCNDYLLRLTGWKREEVLGKNWFQIFLPGDIRREVETDLFRRSIAEGNIQVHYENEIQTKEGIRRAISWSNTILRDDDNTIVSIASIGEDVTERKRADEALRKSREEFKDYFEMGSIGMCVTSPDKGWVEVNDRLCRMLGYSKEELSALTWAELTHPDDLKKDLELFGEIMSGARDHYELDKRFIRKDGGVVCTTMGVTCQRNPDGSVFQFMASLQDITERMRMESELESSRLLYKLLAENSSDSVSLFNAEGKLEYVSPSQLRLLGYEEQDVVNLDSSGVLLLVHPDDRERIAEEIKMGRVLKQPITRYEYRARTKSGGYIWVEDVLKREFDKNGEIIRTIINSRDITERKRGDELLKANELKFRTLADHTLDWEYWKNERQEIVYMSTSCERITGHSREEFMADASLLDSIIHPDDRSSMEEHGAEVHSAEHREEVSEIEYRIVNTQGKTVFIHHVCRPIYDDTGAYLGRRVSNRDITERMAAEEALRNAQRLESIGTLAGGIAHDFNNLLNAMMGNVALARNRIPADSPAVKNLDRTMAAMERAATLTKQMLAYSGKGKFQVVVVDLVNIVREHIDLFEASLPKNVMIETELSALPVTIKGDPGQIEQVVMNIIINAGEAIGDDQGIVKIEVSTMTAADQDLVAYSVLPNHSLKAGEYARFRVSDNGQGMNNETIAKIFDPFFTTKFVGRGLGLSAVLGIIRGHSGGMTVQSIPGAGTIFDVILPLHRTDQQTLRHKPGIPEITKHIPTVFLIDDEQYIIDMTEDVFSEVGYQFHSASDPVAGLNMFREQWRMIDVVILDYAMPKLNGKEVLLELRKIDPQVNVIMSSGYSEEELTHLLGDTRPTAMLQKPHVGKSLIALVDTMLKR